MKSLLVAIDFSNCSVNALLHAAQLAYLTDSRLEMIWVNNPEKTRVNVQEEASTALINEMNIQFKRLTDELHAKYKGLKVDYLIREGKVYKEVGLQALESNSWLIVAGTHGRSGFEKFWIGSNVYRIVSTAPCPVFTVRSGINISDRLNIIVLPIDSTSETREKVSITTEIARVTMAKVIILKLYSTEIIEVKNVVNAYADQVAEFLKDEKIEVEMDEAHAVNLTETTIDYAKKVNANLIVIMTEQEKKVANFLLGNFAQQMINHSPVPVLSVRPKGLG
jgi:nucleotide-binding universal stress UspA family protein